MVQIGVVVGEGGRVWAVQVGSGGEWWSVGGRVAREDHALGAVGVGEGGEVCVGCSRKGDVGGEAGLGQLGVSADLEQLPGSWNQIDTSALCYWRLLSR
ncbi:hypothetical protein BN6_57650 [Saccharothrix espanaensis DSM 44229]|uniref:Uncharacterized protein n=1 Tax=Saccharothrix espanaensis (strain ATCC 51144 / DSM 44229 / JCM 9112 / NBRC 15066 / NRRL 15764) TaxID=1179773 RepID=K0K8R5_SACES|nr:hypothetical protein BN6_57650 [Saccharothrix espanaensis DSM 44229]